VTSQGMPPTTTVVAVEVDEELGWLAESAASDRLADSLGVRVRKLVDELGLATSIEVFVSPAALDRVLQVTVNDRVCPYSPLLMKRLWMSTPAADVSVVHTVDAERSGPYPDAWFRTQVAKQGQYTPGGGHQGLLDYLAALAQEAMRLRPEAFVTPGIVEALLLDRGFDVDGLPVSLEQCRTALSTLLLVGISLRMPPVPGGDETDPVVSLVQALEAGAAIGRPVEDTVEDVLARFAAPRVEILASPEYLEHLLEVRLNRPVSVTDEQTLKDAAVRQPFVDLQARLNELGISLVGVAWLPVKGIPKRTLIIRVNDQTSAPIRGLARDAALVEGDINLLPAATSRGPVLEWVDGLDGRSAQLVYGAAIEELREAGLSARSAIEYAAAAVFEELVSRRACLVTIDRVEYELSRLQQPRPSLISAVVGLVPMGELARLLRGLARERVSTRDLASILELALEFEATSRAPASSVGTVGNGPKNGSIRSESRLMDFVRIGLGHQLLTNLRLEGGMLRVFQLDSPTTRAFRQIGEEASENDAEPLKRALRNALYDVTGEPDRTVAVVVDQDVRTAIFEALSVEFPFVVVLTQAELPAHLPVNHVGNLSALR
jgi:hypothetical protein